MTFFLTHRCMLSTASLVLAVFLWRHEPCCLLTDAEPAFQREQTTGLDSHSWRPSPRLPVPFEAESVSVRVPVGVLSHLHKTSRQTSPDPTGLLTFARLFLGQRRDGIALSLRKCGAGRWRYPPTFPFACQARCGRPHLRLVS